MPVAVVGGQSILLSYCLHSIVDELLRVRAKEDIRQPATHVCWFRSVCTARYGAIRC